MKLSKIDTLKEKEDMAEYLKCRIEALKKREKESGVAIPELRESIIAYVTVLEKIRLETGGEAVDGDSVRERVFGDWRRKIEDKEEDGEKCEG